jgi:uncharacterized protein (DUF362 family)
MRRIRHEGSALKSLDFKSIISNPNGSGGDMSDVAKPRALGRRRFLTGAGAMVAGGLGARALWERDEAAWRADVAIVRSPSYEADLGMLVGEGLALLGLGRDWARGKTVLLKPNLVEPSREAPHVNTHPALVRGVAEAFRRQGARRVLVAEGQGHCRDSDLVLDQSGLGPILDRERLEFVDLNNDEVVRVPNRFGSTRLQSLYLPAALRRADLVVSLPKLKTHHWVGATLAMKNLFGVMPGICYGWPKNVLHHAGIPNSILDITAAVAPHLAIVDGIVGMEGDGPIMGRPRFMGVLVLGTNLPAVDATAARLMGIDPARIPYLAAASGRLGPIAARHIRQRGEPIAPLARRFDLPPNPGLGPLR